MKKDKFVLGFVGEMACGKGTAAAYCKRRYGAPSLRFSTILRETLDRVYLPHTRDNMIFLSENLRGHFGDDVLANAMARDVEKEKKKFITVDGIRRPADLVHLKKFPGFHLVAIEAQAPTRFERMRKRRENQDDQTKTWEQFKKDSQRSTEITIRGVMKNADFVIDNNGSFQEFHQQIDGIIKKLKKQKGAENKQKIM